jgi:hypothetical protein
MAKRLAIPSDSCKLTVVGQFDSFDVSRLQRVNINTDIPTTDVYELGNVKQAGTTQDTPNVTLSFSLFDVGIKAFSVLTGTDPTNYPAEGVSVTKLDEVDAIIYIKDAVLNDYVKSAHARRLQVRDFAFSYNVEGESTEDYTLIGSEKRFFKNDVIVDRFSGASATQTLTQTPISLKNGRKLISVIVDGDYLEEVTSAPAAGQYSVSGTTLTLGAASIATTIAVYHASPTGENWVGIEDNSLPAAVRGRDVKIKIAANSIPRIQSVTINGNLNVQTVKEMGNRVIVGYQRQTPTIEGQISVLDTDTELIDLLLNGVASADTEFMFGEGCPDSGVGLEIQIHDPCETDEVVLKTVYIPEITIVGEAFSSNVNQNASQTFNFRATTAECVVYSGAKA